jgi:hypothetical protein
MKKILIIAAGVGTLVVLLFAFLGLVIWSPNDTFVVYFFGAATALIVTAFMLCAREIFVGRGTLYALLKIGWAGAALLCAILISSALVRYIIGPAPERTVPGLRVSDVLVKFHLASAASEAARPASQDPLVMQLVPIVATAMFLMACPVIFSYTWRQFDEDETVPEQGSAVPHAVRAVSHSPAVPTINELPAQVASAPLPRPIPYGRGAVPRAAPPVLPPSDERR